MSRLSARTIAEAHRTMDRTPCACGSREFERHAAVIRDGDVLCSRYAGPCRQCGSPREFVFELPETPPPTPPDPIAAGAAAGSHDAEAGEQHSVSERIAALARTVVRDEGFAGNDLDRHATDLAGQLHTLVRTYQIQAREELSRRESTAEIEQLLDAIVRTGTPIGAAIAAHRADILDAFRQVGIAEIGRGIQVLMQWMRDPTAEHRAPVEQLLAELQTTLGTGELAGAEGGL